MKKIYSKITSLLKVNPASPLSKSLNNLFYQEFFEVKPQYVFTYIQNFKKLPQK
jgi:hypothetical protein